MIDISQKEIYMNHKEWITIKELEEIYNIGISAQAKLRMNRKIPYSKIGKFVRYNTNEINKWLSSHNVEMIG